MQPLLIGMVLVSLGTNLGNCKNKQTAETFIGNRIILLDINKQPTLEYICLKERSHDSFFSISSPYPSFDQILEFNWDYNFTLTSKPQIISTIKSITVSDWLIGQYMEQIETNLPLKSFLLDESYKIETFLKKQQKIQFQELTSLNQELDDLNLSNFKQVISGDPKFGKDIKQKKDSEESFAKYALYLILAGGAFIIYSTLAPSGSSHQRAANPNKIQLARRKRWLVKIFEKGWIDLPTYHFLLKRIETLPSWLGGIRPPDQSEDTSENSVALSNRKRGESVVKTKDTSEDKTSR
jgi:hypothetical protein